MTEVQQSASTSTSSEKDRMEATDEATKILSQGKRNLVCGEVPTAVNQFQEACKLLAKAYGETAKECAEAYFYYGQSLLDLARMETGVLGNALQGVPEEEEEGEAPKSADEQFENGDKLDVEEREKLRIEVYDAMSEKEKEEEKKEGEKNKTDEKGDADMKKEENGDKKPSGKEDEKKDSKEEKSTDKKDDDKKETNESADVKKDEETNEKEEKAEEKSGDEEKMEEEGEEGEEAEGDTAEEGETGEEGEDTAEEGEGGKKGNDEDADDVSNLQLAWEMLELAKVIYLKDDNKEAKLKASDSYLKLGEVSLETEQYEQSIADFNECLNIQKAVLEPEDRSLAETHYQLGLAYCFNKQYDESIDSYRAAIKVLEDRIAKLTKVVEGGATEKKDKKKEDTETEDPVKAAETEVSEIKELLPDMRQKIEDAEEEKKNYEQLKQMAKEAVGFGSSSETKEAEESKTDSKPASNISHLIRRKRKPDEDEPLEQDTKKTKQDDAQGDAVIVNGEKDKEVMEVDKKKTGEELPTAEAVAS